MRSNRLVPLAAMFAVALCARDAVGLPYWGTLGRNPQHTAIGAAPAQSLSRIRWQTAVDRRPQYSGALLLAHYGSPMITAGNTVVVPVKAGMTNRFRVEARRGVDGRRLWRRRSDYVPPPHNWLPSFSPVLSPGDGRLWMPAAGGTLKWRSDPDSRQGERGEAVYYGLDHYKRARRAYRENVFVNTPLTADSAGNVYFGVRVVGATPLNLQSAIVRIAAGGAATTVTPAAASGDPSMTQVVYNCAPALGNDGSRLYVAVSDGGRGYLLALDSTTLATLAVAPLKDPGTDEDALLLDDGTSSPTVGPDGHVYFGVFERPWVSHNAHGWLLHFDADLNLQSPPGGFGWDTTASIVPAAMVPSYLGASSYLVMTKYNNYAGIGSGDGVNRIAVLDPNDSMIDPISALPIMNEVLTVVGPTPDLGQTPYFPNAVREWCINTCAVDPITGAVFANSSDGKLYRWDMGTGVLSESIVLTAGIFEAYTPTALGPDGTVYAVNNGVLFAVGD